MNSQFSTYKLGEVADIIAGGDKPKKFSPNKNNLNHVPVFANAEKNNGLLGYTDTPRIIEPSVTVAARGSNVGFVAVRKEPFFPIVRLLTLIPKREQLDVDYLFYNLKLNRQNGTGSGQPQITTPGISSRIISLPPILTQQKVAKVLSSLDAKIELNKCINAELEAMAKTLYDYWFVQFDFPDANGKPYKTSGGKMVYNPTLKREIPEGWELVPIEYFADVIDPHPSHRAPKEVDDGYPFAGIGDIDGAGNISTSKSRQIDEEFVLKQERDYEIGEYSLGYGRVGTVGKVVRLKKQKFRYALSPTLAVINPKKPEYAGYVYAVVKSNAFYKQVLKNTSGTTRPAVGIQLLRKIPVLKPATSHKTMFEKYEEITREIFEKTSITNQENQNLIELSNWLLPMLMNGQVTVT